MVRTFRGAVSNDWHDPANWLEGAVPTAADDATFDKDSPTCRMSADATCHDLVVHRDCPGVLDTNGFALKVTGDYHEGV